MTAQKPPFFCFGSPKSGTTFLQRMLDVHPEISCPSEQLTSELAKNLQQFYAAYNEGLAIADDRTGGQGVQPISKQAVERIFACHVQVMAEDTAQGKPIFGLSDNALGLNIGKFLPMFPTAKFIRIVRNPVDRGVSLWRYNHEVHKNTGNEVFFAKFMEASAGTVEGCILHYAALDAEDLRNFIAAVGDNPNVLIIRYEDFSQARLAGLKQIYEFLGAETSPQLLEELAVQGQIGTMAQVSKNKAFFSGGGRTDFGGNRISPEIRRQALEIMKDPMQRLGYDLSALPEAR
jgi:hypothetical protein